MASGSSETELGNTERRRAPREAPASDTPRERRRRSNSERIAARRKQEARGEHRQKEKDVAATKTRTASRKHRQEKNEETDREQEATDSSDGAVIPPQSVEVVIEVGGPIDWILQQLETMFRMFMIFTRKFTRLAGLIPLC